MSDAIRVHRVTALIAFVAVAFAVFFELGKNGPFREINPFGDDPYDAVGSFGVQVALVVAVLSYARALRWRSDASQASKARLILRGDALVLSAILITLVADGVAEMRSEEPPSSWGAVLRLLLVGMFLLVLASAVAVVRTGSRVDAPEPPSDLTLADGLDDVWTLVRIPVSRAAALPRGVREGLARLSSDRVFAKLPWIDPRRHPWRFAWLSGLAAGVAVAAAQLVLEGPAPRPRVAVLLALIFTAGELAATLAGFALLGARLGLRPASGTRDSRRGSSARPRRDR
ncbi:MAG: hypothetical protein U0167_07870 [bacterium]